MTTAEEGPYDGQNWPTHSVVVWIMNDAQFYETAVNYARLDEDGAELRGHLTRLLFDRDLLAEQEWRRLTPDNRRTLDLVVGSLSPEKGLRSQREAFGTVNWKYVQAALLGE